MRKSKKESKIQEEQARRWASAVLPSKALEVWDWLEQVLDETIPAVPFSEARDFLIYDADDDGGGQKAECAVCLADVQHIGPPHRPLPRQCARGQQGAGDDGAHSKILLEGQV